MAKSNKDIEEKSAELSVLRTELVELNEEISKTFSSSFLIKSQLILLTFEPLMILLLRFTYRNFFFVFINPIIRNFRK